MINKNKEMRAGWIHEFYISSTATHPYLYYIPVIFTDTVILYTENGISEIGKYKISEVEKSYYKIIPIKKFDTAEPKIGQDEYLKRMGIR